MFVSDFLTSDPDYDFFIVPQKFALTFSPTSHELFSPGRLGGWENMDVRVRSQGLFGREMTKDDKTNYNESDQLR